MQHSLRPSTVSDFIVSRSIITPPFPALYNQRTPTRYLSDTSSPDRCHTETAFLYSSAASEATRYNPDGRPITSMTPTSPGNVTLVPQPTPSSIRTTTLPKGTPSPFVQV